MPIPAYMWLKDDGGSDIKGPSLFRDVWEVSKWLVLAMA